MLGKTMFRVGAFITAWIGIVLVFKGYAVLGVMLIGIGYAMFDVTYQSKESESW